MRNIYGYSDITGMESYAEYFSLFAPGYVSFVNYIIESISKDIRVTDQGLLQAPLYGRANERDFASSNKIIITVIYSFLRK